MRIVLVTRDSVDLWKHEYFRDFVQNQFSEVLVKIICGELNRKLFKPKQDVHYVFDGYEEHLKKYAKLTDKDIISVNGLQSSIVPSCQYKSDMRYVRTLASERNLVLEQIYLVEQAKSLLQNFEPELLFMTGGPNLIRNVFFLVGQYLKVRCYRMLNISYLNPDRVGVRYWFNSNNYCRLSNDNNDKFNYPEAKAFEHAEKLFTSIRKGKYELDKYARTTAQQTRVSIGLKTIFEDVKNTVSFRRFRFNRKSQSWNKLRSFKNHLLNKKLATKPYDIPKPFFLFPLNVPEDAQLVLRAPHLKDLLSICEQIANVLPYKHILVIKEHPGHPGMLDNYRLKALLRYHQNIFYVPGNVRLWDLLEDATALITINSTSALEALAKNIPVVTVGEAFYRGTGLTYDVDYLLKLPQILSEVIVDSKRQNRKKLLLTTISNFLQETVPPPGKIEELDSPKNNYLNVIAKGILAKIENL